MSLTRQYLGFMQKGFRKIGKFAISPWTWAAEGFGGESEDTGNISHDVLATGVCLACGCAICCCRSPFAFAGSLITLPVGGTTAVIFGVVGSIPLPVTLAVDGVKACVKTCGKQDENTTQQASESTASKAAVQDENNLQRDDEKRMKI